MSRALDELLAGGRSAHSPGCPLCGKTCGAQVSIIIRRLGANNQVSGTAGTTRTRAVSLCEQHAVELWKRFESELP